MILDYLRAEIAFWLKNYAFRSSGTPFGVLRKILENVLKKGTYPKFFIQTLQRNT